MSNNLVSLIAAGKRWANLPRPWSGTLAFSGNSARASEIKRRLDLGESQRSIARACGCSRALVSDIKAGRRWCDLPAGAAA